jgi:hypothetical protein
MPSHLLPASPYEILTHLVFSGKIDLRIWRKFRMSWQVVANILTPVHLDSEDSPISRGVFCYQGL